MDRAKLLSEVSRYASGKCDQRVVKTWINESAEMIEFVRSIMEDKYGVKMIYTYGDEAKWPAENAEHKMCIRDSPARGQYAARRGAGPCRRKARRYHHPVSRQRLLRPLPQLGGARPRVQEHRQRTETVSYTHLDGYKRQALR